MTFFLSQQVRFPIRITQQHLRKSHIIGKAIGKIVQSFHAGSVLREPANIVCQGRLQPLQKRIQLFRLILHQIHADAADTAAAHRVPVMIRALPGTIGRCALQKRIHHPAEDIFPHQLPHILRQLIARQTDDFRQGLSRL